MNAMTHLTLVRGASQRSMPVGTHALAVSTTGNIAFRRVFTQHLWPDLDSKALDALDELQNMSTSPENADRILNLVGEVDVTGCLSEVRSPTLVLHSRGDAGQLVELGLALATGIRGAQFVEVPSRNHVPASSEPAWPEYIGRILAFCAEVSASDFARSTRPDP
ncbi:alpha/beta fold hydrolase [Sabulicella glaciei]|uniref:Alpha/beta hydrolase n=1 Tax=Sabulicella glaciei TaxID=2984948 RepID=A0ABT3P1Y1_9PROT|nr:hypothetical protein [Roseococcus sp. MDT2-1-1]MCW8088428.1 hypothetical protein [Roseococcus sp. MDT2-1-1]